MRLPILVGLAAVVGLAFACSSPEQRAEKAREAVQQALARGDREAALGALVDLRANLPDTAD